VILRGGALVLRGMLQQLGGFQVMIHALLRHMFRIANGVQSETSKRYSLICSS
jgi:hypothetical protein